MDPTTPADPLLMSSEELASAELKTFWCLELELLIATPDLTELSKGLVLLQEKHEWLESSYSLPHQIQLVLLSLTKSKQKQRLLL